MTALARRMRDTADLLELLAKRYKPWTIWCDLQAQWTATRPPRPSEQPSPGSYLVWVYAKSPDELMTRMDDPDQTLGLRHEMGAFPPGRRGQRRTRRRSHLRRRKQIAAGAKAESTDGTH